jgi:hypothetical protein
MSLFDLFGDDMQAISIFSSRDRGVMMMILIIYLGPLHKIKFNDPISSDMQGLTFLAGGALRLSCQF